MNNDVIGNLIEFQASHSRGHQFNVAKPSINKHLNCRLFSFKHRVREQWNNLPEPVVSANTINTFKNKLDKLWEGTEVYFKKSMSIN